MELVIFARFHAQEGQEEAVDTALKYQVAATREEPGCLNIRAFRATRDPRLFFIHSRWKDVAAFEIHAELANTHAFIERMQTLIDHPFEAVRTLPIG